MLALIERVSTQTASEQPVTREQLRSAGRKPKAGRPRAYVFQYRPKSKEFSLRLNFRKSEVETTEVIDALLGIIEELRLAKRHA
jgi:hypothetical protein